MGWESTLVNAVDAEGTPNGSVNQTFNQVLSPFERRTHAIWGQADRITTVFLD
jgi:hypothetical protein